jgi:hypothetical protein
MLVVLVLLMVVWLLLHLVLRIVLVLVLVLLVMLRYLMRVRSVLLHNVCASLHDMLRALTYMLQSLLLLIALLHMHSGGSDRIGSKCLIVLMLLLLVIVCHLMGTLHGRRVVHIESNLLRIVMIRSGIRPNKALIHILGLRVVGQLSLRIDHSVGAASDSSLLHWASW